MLDTLNKTLTLFFYGGGEGLDGAKYLFFLPDSGNHERWFILHSLLNRGDFFKHDKSEVWSLINIIILF